MEQNNTYLNNWGLPDNVVQFYNKKGIERMFEWQCECLLLNNVLNGGNLVYSAPTSAGKTLVAEILVSQTVFDRKKKALIILPFVSVVREKMFYFQDMLTSSGVRVEGYMGGHSPCISFDQVQVAICTIEKANSYVNRMMEEKTLSKLGIVVVDELHLLSDPYRGYLLELLLTKLKYMSTVNKDVQLQIVGMSASLPNLNAIAKWLNADLYFTSFRPIPLLERLKCGLVMFNERLEKIEDYDGSLGIECDDGENIGKLCLDTIRNGHSVLIFCPTKIWCENLAGKLATLFRTLGCSPDAEIEESLGWFIRQQLDLVRLQEVVDHLKASPVGLDHELARSITFGVAFHHAGLTLDERDIVEGSFRSGVIRVLCATSTLSSGVNLPARRVIIRSPMSFGGIMDILTYRQMIGRAGRMGVDTQGESILICKPCEKEICRSLMTDRLKPIESSLGCGKLSGSLKRALLEVIASGVAASKNEIEKYISCTFLSSSARFNYVDDPLMSCINFLANNELIRFADSEDKYLATPLGQACLASSLPPDEGLALFRELERARRCFVLDSDLHIIYQVTPYSVSEQWSKIDWLRVLNMLEELNPSMRRVAELVGVEDAFLVKVVRGTINVNSPEHRSKLSIHRRFYTALALQDLVNEVPLPDVAQKFDCNKGLLQSLQQSAATYAGMVSEFAKRLRWGTIELIVSQFQERLQFGVHRELCELMRLTSLNGVRARAVFNAGFKSLAVVAKADVNELEAALLSSLPFQSKNQQAGETEYDHDARTRSNVIWVTGRSGLTVRSAAEKIIQEARNYIEVELGLDSNAWGAKKSDTEILYDASTVVKTPERSIKLNENSINTPDLIEDTPHPKTLLRSRLKKIIQDSQESVVNSMLWESFRVPDIPDSSSIEESAAVETYSELADTVLVDSHEKTVLSAEQPEEPTKRDYFATTVNISELPATFYLEHISSPDLFTTPQRPPLKTSIVNNLLIEPGSSSGFFSDTSPVLLENSPCTLETVTESFFYGKRKASPDFIPGSESEEEDNHLSRRSKISRKLISPKRIKHESPKSHKYESPRRSTVESPKMKSESPKGLKKELLLKKSKCEPPIRPEKQSPSGSATRIDTSLAHMSKFESPTRSNSPKYNRYFSPRKPHVKVDVPIVTLDESDNDDAITMKQCADKDIGLHFTGITWDTMNVVDVCGHLDVFQSFCEKINQQSIVGLALGCEKKVQQPRIGANFKKDIDLLDESHFSTRDTILDGISFYWSHSNVFYLSFKNTDVPLDKKIIFLKTFFNSNKILRIFDAKEQLKFLIGCIGVAIASISIEDPKVATWLLSKSNKEIGLVGQLMEYLPRSVPLAQLMGTLTGFSSPGLNIDSATSPKVRSACEAMLTFQLLSEQINILKENHLYKVFTEIEMPTQLILVQMETTGFQFNENLLKHIKNTVDSLLNNLEEEACKIVGYKFSLSSYNTVARVLFNELRLGTTDSKKRRSTSKDILETIFAETKHPLPSIILQWRKLKAISSKILFPLLQLIPGNRIYGCSQTYSATGRITMKEPNLQTFPKDFSLIISDNPIGTIQLRKIFVASEGYCLISADYCQLELRILAHLSNDAILMSDIKDCADVFIKIAASVHNVMESQVSLYLFMFMLFCTFMDFYRLVYVIVVSRLKVPKNNLKLVRTCDTIRKQLDLMHFLVRAELFIRVTENLRQRTKQICYGIIYGIGMRSLAVQLNTSEEEALKLMSDFKARYKGVAKFATDTLMFCREHGYVETIAKRRRYFPSINDKNSTIRTEAERQAFNMVVQGSAADIAKKAMVQMYLRCQDQKLRDIRLVLHLHDELLYEVPLNDKTYFCEFLRNVMETAWPLSVPLPVKLKSGSSWGSLKPIC